MEDISAQVQKNNIKVSVILPVWNPGEGIHKCIASLCNQTLKDIEMIFVDDLGTDDSMDAVRATALEDPRIRILVNEKNLGSGPSRNRGIEAAVGEYLSFVDPDDYLADNFLELLYNKAVSSGADIIKGDRALVNENGDLIPDTRTASLNDLIRRGLTQKKPLCTLFGYDHWTAIYRREWLMSSCARYGASRNAQDVTFLLQATYNTDRIAFDDTALYYYVARTGSRVRDFSARRLGYELDAIKEQLSFLTARGVEEEIASVYLAGKLYYLLRLQASCALKPELLDAANDFLRELRSIMLKLPYAYRIAARDRLLGIFLIYEANLIVGFLGEKWGEVTGEEYLDAVKRVVSFLCAHPEQGKELQWLLRMNFDRALAYRGWSEDSGLTKKEAYLLLRQEAERLPDQTLLTDQYLTLNVFTKTGMNLYHMSHSGFAEAFKKSLPAIRKVSSKLRRENKKNSFFIGRSHPVRSLSEKSVVHHADNVLNNEVPIISVILPVYNPGKGVTLCLQSLQNQTLSNIEMLFIDDCGTDNAMQIIESASKKDQRIRIIKNTTNIGAGPSRNRGIELAGGEYLAFVDADDYLDERFLELLYETASATDADIVKGKRIKIRENGEIFYDNDDLNSRIRKGVTEGNDVCFLYTYEH